MKQAIKVNIFKFYIVVIVSSLCFFSFFGFFDVNNLRIRNLDAFD